MEKLLPQEIEAKSFAIIDGLLGEKRLEPGHEHIIKRCIHTSADFDYADNLCFSQSAVEAIAGAFKNGSVLVTDTKMAAAGVNKKALEKCGIELYCFIADADVADRAQREGMTRAAAAVDKAVKLGKPAVFAVGNAPTALLRLHEHIAEGFKPQGIIGVPVGFVNVVESKEMIMSLDVPYIVAKGRKGGSNIAAAICNAILYSI